MNVVLKKNLPTGNDQIALAYQTGNIVINPDSSKIESEKRLKEEMIKRAFFSSASIPIKKNNKIVAVLNIYASDPYYFEEENRTILEELQKDISFALEKIESIKYSQILEAAIKKSNDWVIITDRNGTIEYVNDFVTKLTGYSKEELLGKKTNIFRSGYHDKHYYRKLWQTILSGKEFEAIFINRKKNGELFYIEEKIIPVTLKNNEMKFISIGSDITKERKLKEENEKLRFYDILTDIYNFYGFSIQVDDYILKNPESLGALIVIDIVNFSYINKTYTIEVGNKILQKIAKILKENFKKEDILGRIGGDEFGIFIKNLQSKEEFFAIANRIKLIMEEKSFFTIDQKKIKLYLNCGVAFYPDDGSNFKELLQNASIALKEAKKEGLNTIKLYDKKMETKILSLAVAEDLIQKAIKGNLFIFHYQPYYTAKTKEIAGFEALVRIKDGKKIHYPNEFIDLLENSIYLDDFRAWALQEVSQKIKQWNRPISVNISAKSFNNPELPKEIRRYTKDIPQPLTIEITERLYMEQPDKSKRVIEKLKRYKKIKISIDDFGTGYSSLSYLKDIRADILKIDISFVKAMTKDKGAKAIVEAIITLAKNLEMETVAEGVENEIEYEMLKNMGTDYIQGYYFAKPLPEDEVEHLLRNSS